MFTVLDCNNFWSPTGGGVRRYHLEKMAYYASHQAQAKLVFVVGSDQRRTEQEHDHVVMEHVPAAHVTGGYRVLLRAKPLREVLRRHRPDVVEVGSPYLMPWLVKRALRVVRPRPAVVGFWHADFPRTYIGRPLGAIHPRLNRPAEALGWRYARRSYGWMDAVFVASRRVAHNIRRHGLDRAFYTPLGVHSDRFHPKHRDGDLVETLQEGDPERRVIFFPHRFLEEKGVHTLLAAYPAVVDALPHPPLLVLAGDGPLRSRVERAAQTHPTIRYLGYIHGADEMARWYASSDLSVALSAFETFGLSAAEAMASGLAVIGADEGAAAELVEDSGCGLTVPYGDTEALTGALIQLLREPELRRFGERGRDYIRRFTWPACFERQLGYYRWIARRVRRGASVPSGLHTALPD